MDKILQQIGTFLGRKFSKIYTIFNDKYNELDNKKVDKEEGKELMPSPEGASDTVFLSETGWREVNTDKIRTHVISISIPFDSAWDFNGTQEITLEEGDYDRDEADSFIYDYFRYNNPNVVIRNTNTTAQSAQKGYHTVWKVALDTIAEGRALRLYLDIPKNLSFTMAPEADSAKFTRYCILLYLSQDEGNQTYILNNIGILPNGTDSFIPRKYLDGKLSDITSSYLPLSGGLMTGNIAFPDGKGLGSAVGQSDLLVRSGNTVKLGSAGFSARLYAENPVVREGLEGMFTMYDTSNLDIDKPFVTNLWAVYDAEGKNTQSIAVDLYNPVAKSATKVYRELLPVTDTNMGLITPYYKSVLDGLISTSGNAVTIYGTPSATWTVGTVGPKLKNSGGIFELRNNIDNAYTDLILNNLTIKGNVTQEGSSFITEAETVEVSDNILLLNRGEVGSGVTKGISGIQVDRGDLTDYQFIFDESDDRFKVGVEGDLWPVMLRNNESDLSDKFFLSWDASLKRAVTTNIVPETGLLFSGGVSNHPEYDITVAATGSGSIGFGALQANTPWSCTIGYNLNTREVPSADILDFATSLNAYRYDKPSVLNMIYFDTYLSPNSIEPYGTSSISLTTGSGDNLIHTKGGQNYIIYDSGNLNIEELATKDDISGLGTVYYPYSGRGYMTIGADGRPILANSNGILFNKTGGERVEGIYMGSNNHLVLGGSSNTNVPIDMFNDLGITRILDRSTNYSLLVFTNGGTGDSQYTHIGAELGTTRIRSGLFNLVHDRGGTLYTIFDSYNFSRDLGSTNINSSFNHLPMMAAQPSNSDATTDRGYPIQNAGSLIVIPGVYGGSSQIYGTYNSNRWFVRSGSPTPNNENDHTAWKELATTSHLSNYLPLSGGTMSGNIRIPYNSWIEQTHTSGSNATSPIKWLSNDASTIMAQIGHATMGGPDSSGSIYIIPRAITSTPWDGTNGLFIYKGGVKIDGEELAKVSQISSTSNFLPLSGGTLTRTTAGPVLSLKNTSGNKEVYMDFYKGDVRCGYIGAAASNTENIYLYAYDSRDIRIGTTQGSISFETGVNNLIHKKNGTSYTILDTANIASLTIQFNGSTNTTYAPNAAKTVNITPAAIGAAASSHTHTKSQITDFPSSMPASDVYAWAKASSKPSYSWSEITSKPSTFTPSSHTHPLSDISDLQASWDALLKAVPSAYVTRWPSWSEVTSKPSFATVATSGSYNDLSNRPSIPSAETAATIMSKINSQSEITFSKHVVCSAGAGTSSTSDIRFKNNITPLAPVLSHVLGSPGFFYTWKDEDEVLVGTSAQYWEGRITGLVREINDKSKTKTFSYERYTVILQEALKEEHMLREAEKEEYRKEICSLREELEDLKKLIQKLL
uniref:Pyocin knob n=1 Tax=Dulem virus 41 TaxID=3145759 RepID=A0AAU8B0R5_9CAUD